MIPNHFGVCDRGRFGAGPRHANHSAFKVRRGIAKFEMAQIADCLSLERLQGLQPLQSIRVTATTNPREAPGIGQ